MCDLIQYFVFHLILLIKHVGWDPSNWFYDLLMSCGSQFEKHRDGTLQLWGLAHFLKFIPRRSVIWDLLISIQSLECCSEGEFQSCSPFAGPFLPLRNLPTSREGVRRDWYPDPPHSTQNRIHLNASSQSVWGATSVCYFGSLKKQQFSNLYPGSLDWEIYLYLIISTLSWEIKPEDARPLEWAQLLFMY